MKLLEWIMKAIMRMIDNRKFGRFNNSVKTIFYYTFSIIIQLLIELLDSFEAYLDRLEFGDDGDPNKDKGDEADKTETVKKWWQYALEIKDEEEKEERRRRKKGKKKKKR